MSARRHHALSLPVLVLFAVVLVALYAPGMALLIGGIL